MTKNYLEDVSSSEIMLVIFPSIYRLCPPSSSTCRVPAGVLSFKIGQHSEAGASVPSPKKTTSTVHSSVLKMWLFFVLQQEDLFQYYKCGRHCCRTSCRTCPATGRSAHDRAAPARAPNKKLRASTGKCTRIAPFLRSQETSLCPARLAQ